MSNLTQNESLARAGIALELAIVLAQALTAPWFYRLFRSVDAFTAGSLAVFGTVNAVAILGGAALLATALEVADDASLTVRGGAAATVQLLYVASGHLWGVAALFTPGGCLLTVPAPVGEVGITGYLIPGTPTWPRGPESRSAAHRVP